MKVTATILRVVSGLILLFAGVAKLNDPVGYAIKLNEYFDQIKKDASVGQDTIRVSLKDGIKTLNETAFRLYAGENSKYLLIRQELEVQAPKIVADTSTLQDEVAKDKKSIKIKRSKKKIPKPKPTYLVKVGVFLDGNAAGDTSILFKDSGTATLLTVGARIRNQSVFQKSFKVIAAGSGQDQKSFLNLESYIRPESRTYHFFNTAKRYNIGLAIIICVIEFLLGMALLFGWGKNISLGLNVFFVSILFSLSLYAFSRGNLIETGVFGQGIKISPLWALIMDASLMIFSLFLIFTHVHFSPLFSRKTGSRVMFGLTIASLAFGAYSYFMLPLWDVSPFKPGSVLKTNTYIPTAKERDIVSVKFVLHKGKDSMIISASEYAKNYEKLLKEDWKIKRRIDKMMKRGKRRQNDGFALFDPRQKKEVTDSFLGVKAYKWLLVLPFTENAYIQNSEQIKALHAEAKKQKMLFMAATASPQMQADAFVKQQKWPFYFVNADKGLLERMAGFNPTLYLIDGNRVLKKWSGLYLPSSSYVAKK